MFRFTIRDVLWLTVVVALAVGWWVEHRRFTVAYPWRTRAGALEQLLIDQGYEVGWNAAGSNNVDGESVTIKKDDRILGGARTDVFQPNLPAPLNDP
jgi:hypothetical protein